MPFSWNNYKENQKIFPQELFDELDSALKNLAGPDKININIRMPSYEKNKVIKSGKIEEIRDALDNLHDNNYCRTDYTDLGDRNNNSDRGHDTSDDSYNGYDGNRSDDSYDGPHDSDDTDHGERNQNADNPSDTDNTQRLIQ